MQAFPDMNRSFNMFTTLAEEFYKNKHEVFVVALETEGQGTKIRIEKNIPILRVWALTLKNPCRYIKGISNLILPHQYFFAIQRYFSNVKFDLIITATPPFVLADLIRNMKQRFQCPVYVILRDIFPQSAVDLNFMKKESMTYNFFRKKETRLYQVADHIGCMSEGNVSYVLKYNPSVPARKLHILRNWQIKNKDYPSQDFSLKEKYGIKNKFVALFGGNMGKPQQLENILALAKSLEAYEDVIFLLLGEGAQKEKIANLINENKQKNVILKDVLPKNDYQKLVGVCEIGLISLHQDLTVPNIPSKALDYFNLGIPVLASLDSTADFGKLLDNIHAGLWSYASDISSFRENFLKLYHDPVLRKKMGQNGRRYFETCLIPELAYQTIIGRI